MGIVGKVEAEFRHMRRNRDGRVGSDKAPRTIRRIWRDHRNPNPDPSLSRMTHPYEELDMLKGGLLWLIGIPIPIIIILWLFGFLS